ncbi:unnamed protein product, partial [Symbiodinium pilosum]
MAALCETLLGEETTTTTTMWFKTPAYRRTLELHAQLLEAIWVDGYTMAAEFQSWLQTRVLAILVGITVGLPTLVAICYRYSSRFRRWTTCFDSLLKYRLCFGALTFPAVAAALTSAVLGFRILESIQPLMEDTQEYYLSSMTGRLIDTFIQESYRFSELGMAGTMQTHVLASQLCNPTDAPFQLHKLDVDARLEDEVFMEGGLRAPVAVQPSSVSSMVLEYIVAKDWQRLVGPSVGVVVDSALSNLLPNQHSTMTVSFIVRTRCTIRNTDVLLGIRANFPFLLANLPEVWTWNATYYADKYNMWSMLYD